MGTSMIKKLYLYLDCNLTSVCEERMTGNIQNCNSCSRVCGGIISDSVLFSKVSLIMYKSNLFYLINYTAIFDDNASISEKSVSTFYFEKFKSIATTERIFHC